MVASVSGQDTLQQEYDRLIQELASDAAEQFEEVEDVTKRDLKDWLESRDEQPHEEMTGFILMNSSSVPADVYTSSSSADYARALLATDVHAQL